MDSIRFDNLGACLERDAKKKWEYGIVLGCWFPKAGLKILKRFHRTTRRFKPLRKRSESEAKKEKATKQGGSFFKRERRKFDLTLFGKQNNKN